ncbi:MAG: flagellar export chaperone FliS [Treponema sp.]|jgi:flagellar protein FliS|nr:flagellar export chaperone FliS [Treponema sp.]MBQ7970588.1 flagellar export chaperone FliS [Treponema sp.]
MGYSNAYSAYQKTNINTASQGKLIVLLYEGAIKNLSTAVNYFESNGNILPGNIEKFGICLQKTQAIITELEVSLDMEKGGEIAKNLMALYVYFNEELMNAGINKNKEKITFVLEKLKTLADSWRQIVNTTANTQVQQTTSTLNIIG